MDRMTRVTLDRYFEYRTTLANKSWESEQHRIFLSATVRGLEAGLCSALIAHRGLLDTSKKIEEAEKLAWEENETIGKTL